MRERIERIEINAEEEVEVQALGQVENGRDREIQ